MITRVFIDSGTEYIRVIFSGFPPLNRFIGHTDRVVIPNNNDIQHLFQKSGVMNVMAMSNEITGQPDIPIYITGKLADISKKVLGKGEVIMPAAVLWSAARSLINNEENINVDTIGIIDLSASGYMLICVSRNGTLKNDLLIVNPRCGAGTGVNLNRILQKLDINKDDVDHIMHDYLGEAGRENRVHIPIRSDRCGVFSSSATISDKNQGIPLDHALGITMKSEVMKPCDKMYHGCEKVYLTGGVFKWRYARDCADDILKTFGVKTIVYDEIQSLSILGMQHLVNHVGDAGFRAQNPVRLRKSETLISLPAFSILKTEYENKNLYKRIPDSDFGTKTIDFNQDTPVNIGLDIGSTMAKMIVSHTESNNILYKNSYDNHGDTIQTLKHIFRKLKIEGVEKLKIQNIGITGSGRYQVQKTLKAIYPHLSDRITVMVENYAHVWGSIDYAKKHIAELRKKGVSDINVDFCLLIDIGGEDTKISIVSLNKRELFDNDMNIKCSAGTGSLMDTLGAMFDIEEIADAYSDAFYSDNAYGINATCAVFLMENARKMQAEGYRKDEILASCCYAIVENMARSLWNQIEFPKNSLALLHGQTMLSDPLPLTVTHRLQEYTGSDTYCLVPPLPGHRACIGLIQNFDDGDEIKQYCNLDTLLECQFDKRIIICRGAACGDKDSRCSRTKLVSSGTEENFSLTLGGCTAINELQLKKTSPESNKIPNAYKNIWNYISDKLPKSDYQNRLIIPRLFAVSEKAYFLAEIFEYFAIPVHVDNVQEKDVLEGQPLFTIDTCAPNIGAAGQLLRLAREDHGVILVPQIDFLPIEGNSLGRTCATNQGGVVIAQHFAQERYPEARFHIFDLSLIQDNANYIADQLHEKFRSIFTYYKKNVSKSEFVASISSALDKNNLMQCEVADLASSYVEEAIAKKLNISIVSAREYILNPGIYDSHVGKLLRDKGVVAIPVYALSVEPNKQFDFIYWKNPHDLMTKSNAISKKKLHKILKHPRMRQLIRKIETGETDTQISEVTVSTFRCGPDSMTLPVRSEITKHVPSLLIQSDAMIAELAHLENRVNTHLNQMKKNLHDKLSHNGNGKFSIELFNDFNMDGHNKDEFVMYVPTLGDNRTLSAVFRASGFSVVDNFDDETFDLAKKVKIGKKYIGDSACVPLTAIYSDMLMAVNDFQRRKEEGDPLVAGRDKILLFMQYSDGPCRQGQYIDICKLNLYNQFRSSDNHNRNTKNQGRKIKFLPNLTTALHGDQDYLTQLEKWAALQVFQIVVIKDVLHSIFLKHSVRCKNFEEFQKFKIEYVKLKKEIYETIEYNMKPGRITQNIVDQIESKIPWLSGIAKYIGYGFYNNNGLRNIFRKFERKWNRNSENEKIVVDDKIKIHVEGEVYLRIAQLEEIQKMLIDTLGYNSFHLDYSPMWTYFDYMLEQRIVLAEVEIQKYRGKMNDIGTNGEVLILLQNIQNEKNKIKDASSTSGTLRNILARPLYQAAGLKMPHEIKEDIKEARLVLPTLKPEGELIPYVGAAISEIAEGTDLILNIAPEGCMVASMGEMLTPKVLQMTNNKKARIQYLSTTEGEINDDLLSLALLKNLGPENYYSQSTK